MKTFIFDWCKAAAPDKVFQTEIKSSDPQSATSCFMMAIGNLKKNNILKIQEVDKNNQPIGEPITCD